MIAAGARVQGRAVANTAIRAVEAQGAAAFSRLCSDLDALGDNNFFKRAGKCVLRRQHRGNDQHAAQRRCPAKAVEKRRFVEALQHAAGLCMGH